MGACGPVVDSPLGGRMDDFVYRPSVFQWNADDLPWCHGRVHRTDLYRGQAAAAVRRTGRDTRMNPAEFDRVADEYQQLHAANIALTGEAPEYFHEYKVRVLQQIAE